MKVLLIGEFSGLHTNLQKSLRRLGVEVTLMSSGDGVKAFAGDVRLYNDFGGIRDKIERQIRPYMLMLLMKNYDVIQFMHLDFLGTRFMGELAYRLAIRKAGKAFLWSAGCDPVVRLGLLSDAPSYSFTKAQLSKALDDIVTSGSDTHEIISSLSKPNLTKNIAKAGLLTGICSASYEYALGYRRLANYKGMIPLCIDLDTEKPIPVSQSEKLRIFHSVSNNAHFKGSPIILQALELAKLRYRDRIEIIESPQVSFAQFKKNAEHYDVIIDQCNSYGYGMLALFGMAWGKVVFSGAEPEALAMIGSCSAECPVVNIRPDAEHIADRIGMLLDSTSLKEALALRGPTYVAKYHSADSTAAKWIQVWSQS